MIETSPAKVIGRKKSPIQTIEDEFSTGRIQLGGRSGGNEDEPICAVCMDPVINHNDGVDILLACKCRIHYECLIGYIRNQMTDRITLLGHGKDGIICPYISISGCKFSQVFYAENRARRRCLLSPSRKVAAFDRRMRTTSPELEEKLTMQTSDD